jgi:flagellin-like hook-associated protein FlgL
MSNVHFIDGKKYAEVNRKAKVGEKVVVTEYDYNYGNIVTVIELDTGSLVETDGFHEDGSVLNLFPHEYRVLEPLATADTSEASPAVIDMLANLARRVTQLESQLSATQRNLETWAETTENVKHLVESNEQDIAMLDERTQVINAITKFYKEGIR